MVSNDHYFSASPGAASHRRTVAVTYRGRELQLATDRGVFAARHLDNGTKVLLDTVDPPEPNSTVVDVGCGYGPLALAAASSVPSATVWAIDVNERALALTAANAEAHDLANVHTATPDSAPHPLEVDTIWSNPPIRIGKPALHALLVHWFDQLTPTGTAWLVVQKNLGSDSLHRWCNEQGYPTERVISRFGFRVLKVAAHG